MARTSLYLTTPPCPPSRAPDLDLALEAVGADVFARSHRLLGHDVRLVAASLEQGREVERAAYERGGTPEGLADEWAEAWQATLKALNVSHDDFTRTTEPRHQRVVGALFLKLFDQGDVYKGTRHGSYCARCEEFRPGDGACPACGELLAPAAEEAYFLRASRYQKAVVEHLRSDEGFIQPAALRERILETVEETGLTDPCISRARRDWAIAVPIDPEHAIEGWFDALVSYLTTSGYLADPQMFERTWPPSVQVVGPEGLATHALAWPALLAAAGLSFPERLVVRGGLRVADGGPATSPQALASRLGAGSVRYALLRAADYTSDAVFSLKRIIELRNADLSGSLASLVELTLGAIQERRGGRIPRPGPVRALEEPLVRAATGLPEACTGLIEAFDFGAGLDQVWAVIQQALRYAEEAGVAGASGQAARPRRLDTALYILAETCRLVAYSLLPFLPAAAAAIQDRLGPPAESQGPAGRAQWGLTQPETCIRQREPLLPRLVVPAD